jgi:hypothetical protein
MTRVRDYYMIKILPEKEIDVGGGEQIQSE